MLSYVSVRTLFFLSFYGDRRDLHVLTHSFPTRRSSDLLLPCDGCPENEAIKAAARLAPCPSWRKAMPKPLILWFEEIAIADVPAVGGKNASLGEMTAALSQKGVKVPSGFATTPEAYRAFVHDNQLAPLITQRPEERREGKTWGS